jgi:hypothetical protein
MPFSFHRRRAVRLAAALAAACLASGCATTRLEEERVHLFITRAGRQVTLSWDSETDRVYTILVSSRMDSRLSAWTPLEGVVDLPGTGERMTRRDTVSLGEKRVYRLQSAPAR